MHIIVSFSNEFKSEEHVERLKKILYLLEEDKDEVIKRKNGTDCKKSDHDSEEGEMVEEEHKIKEQEEAECKECERVEGAYKEVERVEAPRKIKEQEEAECKECERVEVACKTEEEHKKVFLEICKEDSDKKKNKTKQNKTKHRKKDRELYLVISKKQTVSETKHKNQTLVSFSESVEYNIEKVDKESANLDDTLELNEPSEEGESKVDFRPPDLEQIEKNVGQTI